MEENNEVRIEKRGLFAKAFGEHRKSGGLLNRREFADKWNMEHGKPFKSYNPIVKAIDYDDEVV
jgi:hypothetical protein